MKLVKNFALAVLLALGLAVSAFAGEIPMPTGPSNPPPPARATATSEEVLGNSDAAGTTEISDDLFLEALAALLSIY